MEIFPPREEPSCCLGQKNNLAACLLPCSMRPAEGPWSLVLTMLSKPLLFHLPWNPCAPALPASGTHRSLPKCHSSHFCPTVITDRLNRQSIYIVVSVHASLCRDKQGKTKLDVINHYFEVFSTNRSLFFSLTSFFYYYLTFASFVCSCREVLTGQLLK